MISTLLQVYFLSCCLWHIFYFKSFQGLTFAENSDKDDDDDDDDDDKQLTKMEKLYFQKFRVFVFHLKVASKLFIKMSWWTFNLNSFESSPLLSKMISTWSIKKV